MNIRECLRKIAKSARAQNFFTISKELKGFRIFKNDCDFSNIQEEYLLYLYMYESLSRDISENKISKHVYDKELYEESYLMWKREKGNKIEEKNSQPKDVRLVMGNSIKFPESEEKSNG